MRDSGCQKTTKCAGNGTEAVVDGRPHCELRLEVDHANVGIDARNQTSLEHAKENTAGVELVDVLDEPSAQTNSTPSKHTEGQQVLGADVLHGNG